MNKPSRLRQLRAAIFSILFWVRACSDGWPALRIQSFVISNHCRRPGPTGPTRLTRDEASKLEQNKFVIVPVSGQRVIVLQAGDQLRAFSAKCTHEGCTVTFLPAQSVIWCPCHDGRFDIQRAGLVRAAAATVASLICSTPTRRWNRHF